MPDPTYVDPQTGRTYPLGTPRWCGDGQSPLLLTPLPGLTRGQIDTRARSLWRYRAAFPFQIDSPITLGEGMTPLISQTLHGATVLLKCDWMNPTGSFKDRGASVMLSLLRAQGIGHVLEDSSGNGGAAVAGYAAAGGMRATIMTPASTSPGKTVQMRAYGADIRLIPGSRQDTADAAAREAANIFYASHNWHPFFLQGTKTLAYELWEDLGFHAPDNIVTPCGAGSNVLGCAIGFGELLRAGEIKKLPRIFAVQPANCGPIAASFLAGTDAEVASPVEPTIAEGTAIAQPIRRREVIAALRDSGGGAVLVPEADIESALFELARMGIYVEPTSAQVVAGFRSLLASGAIGREETTVLVMTGSGLKATDRIAERMGIEA
ncbi:MAG: pyridoxal-phosphate dependent enzyme [Acetobacteraceae bacterium]|nr:pyridoxal-phosphate dependent enzyme [Acetobacteraceae bacterium]